MAVRSATVLVSGSVTRCPCLRTAPPNRAESRRTRRGLRPLNKLRPWRTPPISRAIQEQAARKVDPKAVSRAVVGVQIGGSTGSGVIIDDEGHVLTAGYVSGEPGRDCVLILSDGKRAKGKTLGQNIGTDSGMIPDNRQGFLPRLSRWSRLLQGQGQRLGHRPRAPRRASSPLARSSPVSAA